MASDSSGNSWLGGVAQSVLNMLAPVFFAVLLIPVGVIAVGAWWVWQVKRAEPETTAMSTQLLCRQWQVYADSYGKEGAFEFGFAAESSLLEGEFGDAARFIATNSVDRAKITYAVDVMNYGCGRSSKEPQKPVGVNLEADDSVDSRESNEVAICQSLDLMTREGYYEHIDAFRSTVRTNAGDGEFGDAARVLAFLSITDEPVLNQYATEVLWYRCGFIDDPPRNPDGFDLAAASERAVVEAELATSTSDS